MLSYSTSQVHEVQVVFVRDSLRTTLIKTTVFHLSAKRCKCRLAYLTCIHTTMDNLYGVIVD
jgi:hypothetical protein